jgi:hypothetical protein
VVIADGRLVLAGLGGEQDMVFAAPTTNDHVCQYVLPNGGSNCGRPGPDGLTLAWTSDGGNSVVVYGLVGDEIDSVEIVIDGEPRQATMGENAFGARVAAGSARLEAIVLHRRDGTSESIDLRFPRPDD